MVPDARKPGKSKPRSRAAAALFLFLAFGVLAALFVQNARLASKRGALEDRVQELRARIEREEERKEELQEGLEMSQGTAYQEEQLRERGLYKKPGETAVTVVRTAEEPTEEDTGWRWWNPLTWFR